MIKSSDILKSKLTADSAGIYRKYYSDSIPLTKMGGGIAHEVDLAIEVTSNLNKPTRQACNLYFSVNSQILSYLQVKGGEINEAYAKGARSYLGSTFSIEQLLADEVTREIFLVIISAIAAKLIDKVPLFKVKVEQKLYSILRRKTRKNLRDNRIREHADGLAVDIVNSPNIKININKIHLQDKIIRQPKFTKRKRKETTRRKKK